ncbi:MAG: serine/threonine protein kinase, partial [Oscillospiraceae bacterium]|nr:serine/threonine protein kinase [Oscillospiraceae bacterium]
MNGDDALIGKMLGMRYQILEIIGSGGMAVVYKAKCHMLNRYVAVKALKSELKGDSEIVAKFKAESQAAASLSHQNIVSVFDVGEEDGISYIVMEYVEGVTLKEYIKKKGMIPWREACGLAQQICTAIGHAHMNNIIHNDIKPHNILITPENTAKVTDFGIARAVSSVSADTMVVSRSAIGSVYYMSPEQDKGRFTDERSDIYSIGIVFYEMLTGRVPFDGDNHVMISLKKLEEEPNDVRIYNPDIPERVSAVVMKAIAKESHARYQTADDMANELKRVTSKNYDSYATYNDEKSDLSNTRKVKPVTEKDVRDELSA